MKIIKALILIVSLTACTSKIERRNAQEDIAYARKTGDHFYKKLASNDYDGALKLFAPSSIAQTGRERTITFFDSCTREWGAIKEYSSEEGQSKVAFINAVKYGAYELIYVVKRTKYVTREKITLEENSDNQIAIIGYHISSINERMEPDSSR